jgi:coenzyme F420-dependent glucose-6-phosphate dehydrogenase
MTQQAHGDPSFGYTLSSEEFPASELARQSSIAEDAGFDFLTISDHYHPWTTTQGHSPYVWTSLGAVAARTRSVRLGTGVTCPIMRQHPVIVAQAAATASELSEGRFFLGVGTGEALNEHITGDAWPAIERRRRMLVEALDIIRALWTGETLDHHGEHYTVENARVFSVSPHPLDVIWAAAGSTSAAMAAAHADGLWCTSPSKETIDAYRGAGGTGPVYGQVTVCWAPDEARARETALRIWPNAGIPGQLSQDLPTWTHFEQAAQLVREEDLAERVACGPDPARAIEVAREYLDAGVTHLHVHQVGPDQEPFIRWWTEEVQPALRDLRIAS